MAGIVGVWEGIEGEIRFEIRQRLIGFKVPAAPHMDPEGMRLFEDSLRRSRHYLEFGAGGSTVMAAGMGKKGVSVEGDRRYCRDVRAKLHGMPETMKLIYVDIGSTGAWGYPRNLKPTRKSVEAWARYVSTPFENLQEEFYDLVLVDGRFRVACALRTICEAGKRNAEVRLLVDDYHDEEDCRPHYKVIEAFVPLTRIVGRMAVFDISPDTLIKMPDEALLTALMVDSR